jgi:hypothetical protein
MHDDLKMACILADIIAEDYYYFEYKKNSSTGKKYELYQEACSDIDLFLEDDLWDIIAVIKRIQGQIKKRKEATNPSAYLRKLPISDLERRSKTLLRDMLDMVIYHYVKYNSVDKLIDNLRPLYDDDLAEVMPLIEQEIKEQNYGTKDCT